MIFLVKNGYKGIFLIVLLARGPRGPPSPRGDPMGPPGGFSQPPLGSLGKGLGNSTLRYSTLKIKYSRRKTKFSLFLGGLEKMYF